MRYEIEEKLLQGNRAAIMQAAMNCDRTTAEHHDRGEIKRVKSNPGHRVAPIHYVERKTENISAVASPAFQLKVNPAKHQRKSNQRRDNAAPHNQLMHQPTREAPAKN